MTQQPFVSQRFGRLFLAISLFSPPLVAIYVKSTESRLLRFVDVFGLLTFLMIFCVMAIPLLRFGKRALNFEIRAWLLLCSLIISSSCFYLIYRSCLGATTQRLDSEGIVVISAMGLMMGAIFALGFHQRFLDKTR